MPDRPMDAYIPQRMRALPIDPDRPQFYVPWFVAWIDGKPDYRCIAPGKIVDAVRHQKCWLCGQRLGSTKAFVIGPMCAVNRISSEPPSHVACAVYAVRICPFLTQPRMRRNEKGLPETRKEAAGIPLDRNPGCALVWATNKYRVVPATGGVLFEIGDPHSLSWWAEGRAATREEVLASIESGLPSLREMAEVDPQPGAMEALDTCVEQAMRLIPPATPALTAAP